MRVWRQVQRLPPSTCSLHVPSLDRPEWGVEFTGNAAEKILVWHLYQNSLDAETPAAAQFSMEETCTDCAALSPQERAGIIADRKKRKDRARAKTNATVQAQ